MDGRIDGLLVGGLGVPVPVYPCGMPGSCTSSGYTPLLPVPDVDVAPGSAERWTTVPSRRES